MNHTSMSNVTKGIITGVVAGAAIGMIAGWPRQSRHHAAVNMQSVKKNANKALHAVSEIVQNAQYMMR